MGSGGLRGEAPHPTRQLQVVSFNPNLNVFPQPRASLHCRGPVRYLNSSFCFLFASGKESGWSDHPRPHHRHRPAGYPEVAGQVAEANNNSPHPAEPWGFPAVQPAGCAGHVAWGIWDCCSSWAFLSLVRNLSTGHITYVVLCEELKVWALGHYFNYF